VLRAIEVQSPLAQTISIDGGMTRNPWFCQFLADSLGKRLLVSDEPELTALGTARLAAEASGQGFERALAGSVVEPAAQPPGWFETFAEAGRMIRAFGARTAPQRGG
jgi:glycerol kinase